MRIEEAAPSDRQHVLSVERLAFPDEDVATLVSDLIDDPTARPVLSLVAWDEGGRPVGHIMFTAARLEGAPRDVSTVILAPLAVVPEFQRQGLGGRLIEAGIEQLERQGVELVFVLGHPEYYPRHDFEPAIPHGLMAPYPIDPSEAWMVRALGEAAVGHVRGTVACAESMNKPEYWRE